MLAAHPYCAMMVYTKITLVILPFKLFCKAQLVHAAELTTCKKNTTISKCLIILSNEEQ
jgi:hypothetical protein